MTIRKWGLRQRLKRAYKGKDLNRRGRDIRVQRATPWSLTDSRIRAHISRDPDARVAAVVGNRRPGNDIQRNDAGPGAERIVFLVVDGRTLANFRGKFVDEKTQRERGFEFFFVGLARFGPAPGQDMFGKSVQRSEFLLGILHDPRRTQND